MGSQSRGWLAPDFGGLSMPKEGYSYQCDCCGVREDQISDKAREMGVQLHQKEITPPLAGATPYGYLTLCSWCLSCLADDLRGSVKEQLGKVEDAASTLEHDVELAVAKFRRARKHSNPPRKHKPEGRPGA